jgi:hypothetical protein
VPLISTSRRRDTSRTGGGFRGDLLSMPYRVYVTERKSCPSGACSSFGEPIIFPTTRCSHVRAGPSAQSNVEAQNLNASNSRESICRIPQTAGDFYTHSNPIAYDDPGLVSPTIVATETILYGVAGTGRRKSDSWSRRGLHPNTCPFSTLGDLVVDVLSPLAFLAYSKYSRTERYAERNLATAPDLARSPRRLVCHASQRQRRW